jgi:hypothetical protein
VGKTPRVTVWSPRQKSGAVALLIAAPLVFGGGAAPSWASEDRSSARIDLIVSNGGILDPEADHSVSIILRADARGPLGTGGVKVTLTEDPFTSEDQIRRFISGTSSPVGSEVSTTTSPEVPQLESREWEILLQRRLWQERLPQNPSPGEDGEPTRGAGIFGLEVAYLDLTNPVPELRELSGRQIVIIAPEALEIIPANIAPIVTLSASATGGVALRPEELQALTVTEGALNQVTAAVERHPATLGIDSRITLSITALGDQAPEEALLWASTLGQVGLAQFALPWADADPLGSLAIDALVYARLGEFPWIHGAAITNEQLGTLARRSASAVLVSSSALASDRAVVSVGETRVIRVDAQLSDLATNALQAPSELEGEADLQRAQGIIGYRALSGNQETLVFSVGRLPAPAIAPRIDSVLGRLVSMPVSNSIAVPLRSPATEALSGVLGSVPSREKTEFLQEIRTLWESDIAFSTIAEDSEAVAFSRWTRYQALLSSAWLDNPNGLAAEWARAQLESVDFQNSVRVEQGSSITVLSNQTSLPVTVANTLPSNVTVTLVVKPTTGILAVETPETILSIPAEGSVRTVVPVKALANGTVTVDFILQGPNGEQVGEIVSTPVTIRAGWEGVISLALAVVVGGTFAFGLVRAIQRRRQEVLLKEGSQ